MIMLKPVAFLVCALGAGALLAVASFEGHVPTGWIGGVALVAWAFVARWRWTRLEAAGGLEPGAPERILWLRFAGNSLILGHLVAGTILAQDDLRLGSGNTLAWDSWTMVLAQFIAALAFHRDRAARDERHDAIVTQGVSAGYASLMIGVTGVLGWLAYAPPWWRSAVSDFVLANGLVALMLASYGAMLLVQLIAYAHDTRQALAAEEPFS